MTETKTFARRTESEPRRAASYQQELARLRYTIIRRPGAHLIELARNGHQQLAHARARHRRNSKKRPLVTRGAFAQTRQPFRLIQGIDFCRHHELRALSEM